MVVSESFWPSAHYWSTVAQNFNVTFRNKSVTYDVTTSLELDAARGKSTIKSDAAEQIKSYIEDNLLQVTCSKLIEDFMHFLLIISLLCLKLHS